MEQSNRFIDPKYDALLIRPGKREEKIEIYVFRIDWVSGFMCFFVVLSALDSWILFTVSLALSCNGSGRVKLSGSESGNV